MTPEDKEKLSALVATYGKTALREAMRDLPDVKRGPKGRRVRARVGVLRAVDARLRVGHSLHGAANQVAAETDWPARLGLRGSRDSQARQIAKLYRENRSSLDRVRRLATSIVGVAESFQRVTTPIKRVQAHVSQLARRALNSDRM